LATVSASSSRPLLWTVHGLPDVLKPTMAGHSLVLTLHLICCFHSFFLKPLPVTLPFAARFTDGETASRARKCIQ